MPQEVEFKRRMTRCNRYWSSKLHRIISGARTFFLRAKTWGFLQSRRQLNRKTVDAKLAKDIGVLRNHSESRENSSAQIVSLVVPLVMLRAKGGKPLIAELKKAYKLARLNENTSLRCS